MPRVKEFDSEQILEDAMKLFWKNGFHATSMDDLVNHLGINRSSLYNSFGGKKNIFLNGLKLYQDQNLQHLKSILESEASPKKGFKKLFESAIHSLSKDSDQKGCFLVNSSTELLPGDTEIKEFLIENKRKIEEIFTNYLKEGMKKKEIHKIKHPEELATFLFTLYNGIGVVSKLEITPDQSNFMIDKLLKIFEN
ncbi:MAG: TetR/AcrR family transcriptional regulator [Leptospiraceae bacterium]|nr:TetR/AcrR family transcriptional regulator [Leptospiraceae bacterium]